MPACGGLGITNGIESKLHETHRTQIPATLRIGVTGHRNLTDMQAVMVGDSVVKVLGLLDGWLSRTQQHSPHTFVAVSPLAEGADRIVARKVLEWPIVDKRFTPKLEVVLPFPEYEYVTDFSGHSSHEEFRSLLDQARSVHTLKKRRPATGAYVPVGHYVVHACDLLIAVWNGLPANGKGGTGDVVEYARSLGQSIFIINPVDGTITEEWNKERMLKSLEPLDRFNGERLDEAMVDKFVEARFISLEKKAKASGLPLRVIDQLKIDLLPQYARASLLAKRYQSYYMWSGALIYLLSALAVIAVAVQTLFYHGPPILIWAECLMIMMILALMWALEHFELHRHWIDYRFLAERLRISIFLSAAGIGFKPLKYPPYFSLNQQSDYWIVKAFGWTLNENPKVDMQGTFEASKNFLLKAWIDDQLSFYKKKFEKNERTMRRLDFIGYALFLITLVAALAHATDIERFLPTIFEVGSSLIFIAIVFPMVGALLVGFQVQREYKRNAERYKQMIDPLSSISAQIRLADDKEKIADLLEKANDLMLKENQDWRVSILSQKIGV
jgi:hypothetical protein